MKRLLAVLIVMSLLATVAGCGPAAAPTAAPTHGRPAKPTATTAAGADRRAHQGPGRRAHGHGQAGRPGLLRLATTTSTADTGLLTPSCPLFEKANNCKVDVVAVGTGQAIEIGSKGDADVLLVHARASEDKFVADGHAKARFDVMYNDFILVGPKEDPAKAASMAPAKDAFKAIMDAKAVFVSRGDKSGTNTKELSIWTIARRSRPPRR